MPIEVGIYLAVALQAIGMYVLGRVWKSIDIAQKDVAAMRAEYAAYQVKTEKRLTTLEVKAGLLDNGLHSPIPATGGP